MSTYISEPGNWDPSWVNFKPEEFQCSHCQELKIHSSIVDLIQKARNELGPLSITSAYRCSEHNNNVSSTGPNGPHTTGKALDITVKDKKILEKIVAIVKNDSLSVPLEVYDDEKQKEKEEIIGNAKGKEGTI